MIPPSSSVESMMTNDEHQLRQTNQIKVVVVGDVQVGKTSLIQRFIANQLPNIYIPTGFDRYSATYEVGGHRFFANIWDTSGSSTHDTVRPLVYENTDVFLLCFNLGDWYSLQNIKQKWFPEIRKFTSKPNIPVVLIGCQNDLRFITKEEEEVEESSSMQSNPIYPFVSDDLDECKRKIVYTEEAFEISRQIGAITYVETCSYNPLTVREAFEVAALAAHNKLFLLSDQHQNQHNRKLSTAKKLKNIIQMNGLNLNNHHSINSHNDHSNHNNHSETFTDTKNNQPPFTSSPFYGLKHFIPLSSSSTTVSSPTVSNNSFDGCSTSTSSTRLKSSNSSTHLTRNRSMFKLRKCKSKTDIKRNSENSMILNRNGELGSSTSSCSNSELSKKSCKII